MLFDFFVLNRRKYNTLAMYQPHSIYRYYYGVNWRAIVAFVVGIAPNLPGFINSINSSIWVGLGSRPYDFGWMLGFVGTSVVYLALSYIWPPPKEVKIDRAVLPDEIYDARASVVNGIDAYDHDDDEVEKNYRLPREVVLERDEKADAGGYRGIV